MDEIDRHVKAIECLTFGVALMTVSITLMTLLLSNIHPADTADQILMAFALFGSVGIPLQMISVMAVVTAIRIYLPTVDKKSASLIVFFYLTIVSGLFLAMLYNPGILLRAMK